MVRENQSRRDLTKVAQYEVLGMKQKEMSVPQGTIETFGFRSRTRLGDCQHLSIVPSGTDSALKMLTQSGSCRILGYFHHVPYGTERVASTGFSFRLTLSRSPYTVRATRGFRMKLREF